MDVVSVAPLPLGRAHTQRLREALDLLDTDRLEAWGAHLAGLLGHRGGRLLVAGNGGSAAEAQHLTAELVGRLRDDRRPLSALALHAETSTVTAVANDYGYDEVFARQVAAHGHPGDVLLLLSTSGRSTNVLRAAQEGRRLGLRVWGLCGRPGSPLEAACDEAVCVAEDATATVQEVHLVAAHLVCAAVDVALGVAPAERTPAPPPASLDATAPAGAAAGAAAAAAAPAAAGAAAAQAGSRAPLVVVGDVLLDRDLVGRAERLAPDAPVPVVSDAQDRPRPGGAGLAALLAARDGRSVTLVCALGDDDAGRQVRGLLEGEGVRVLDLGGGPTASKVRVRVGGQSLLRLDSGGGGGEVGQPGEAAASALEAAAAVLVADYGRGVAASGPVRALLERAALRCPLVWDPHPRGPAPVPGARLVTPNAAEAQTAGRSVPAAPDTGGPPGTWRRTTAAAAVLRKRWAAGAVAVTLSERGALLVQGDAPPLVVPVPAAAALGLDAPVPDPCGAGDRFAAAAAGALADGALPSEAVAAAVAAASAFVRAGGASAVGAAPADVATAPADVEVDVDVDVDVDVRPAWAPAAALAARVRAGGGTVVATGGCFDLVHAGHVGVLQAARRLGDCLVVVLNSDSSVRRLKGPDRPLVAQDDRARVLEALGCVDAVAVFDEDTPAEVLRALRPDVFAKGGDYALTDIPEAAVVAGWGGQAVVLPYLEGRSTTRLVQEAARRGTVR